MHFEDWFDGQEMRFDYRLKPGPVTRSNAHRADARGRPGCAGGVDDHTEPAVTYANYLQLDELLSLQQPRSDGPEHDELLFIVIHQVYELWFKELLHELDRVAALLHGDEPHRAQHTLKRILTILKVLVAQLDILETMTPLEFLSFRARLEAASGFQSDQFRQIEFVLGAKSESAIARFPAGSRARAALERRYARADAVGRVPPLPRARGLPGARRAPDARRHRAGRRRRRRSRTSCSTSTARDAKNAELCERLVDLDEGFAEWRYRHVRMVERTIGVKPGTGGSSGAAYLRTTLGQNLFPDLWEIRARL